ncbi:MAG TPA: hypothetical protein PKM43_02185 [Verrucomicrobiota bacterium]|nr:hypothetical protein [Verrucomicrobiota bacterium]HRZ37020.1 hypothetical protein [Candidatus Paceibacterota bacterium]
MEPPPPTPRRTRQEQTVEQHHTLRSDQTALEFSNAEEMIRFDAAQTPPPPALGARVQDSVNREPRVKRSWWMRLLGR